MKHHEHTEHINRPKRKWWQWVALALMLLAIGTYVLTLDDSVVPAKISSGTPPSGTGPGAIKKNSFRFSFCREDLRRNFFHIVCCCYN